MSNNVIKLIDRKNKEVSQEIEKQETQDSFFKDAIRRNAENAARLKKEREKANKSVIRSYGLKY
jgi:hypothetical protein